MKADDLKGQPTLLIFSQSQKVYDQGQDQLITQLRTIDGHKIIQTGGKVEDGGVGYNKGAIISHRIETKNTVLWLIQGDSHAIWRKHQIEEVSISFFDYIKKKLRETSGECLKLKTVCSKYKSTLDKNIEPLDLDALLDF